MEEWGSNWKRGRESGDAYSFGLQGINFSLDRLLLLVVRGLVGFASTMLNECDRQSRGSRRGRRVRFRGSRGTVSVGSGGLWFFGLRILGGGSFGFGRGNHGRGNQGRREDVDRYKPRLYAFAPATWRDMK